MDGAFDFLAVFGGGVPEIVVHLKPQPKFGAVAEKRGQA